MIAEDILETVEGETQPQVEAVIPPNNTLYLNNLNERVKLDDLKQELVKLFSEFGNVLEVKAKQDIKMRGQAFIVFDEVPSAMKAKETLSRSIFFGKELNINFAKSKSDVITKREGVDFPKRVQKIYVPAQFIEERLSKKKLNEQNKSKETTFSKMSTQPQQQSSSQNTIIQPHHTLFLENLPPACTPDLIKPLFVTFAGFKEVRLVASKRVAFVEFEDELKASLALQALPSFSIGENQVSCNFAKA